MTDTVIPGGYTQSGASPNTQAQGGSNAILKIELNGANAGGAIGLKIGASNSTVKGLIINRFDNRGIFLISPAKENRMEGNFIGTDASGTLNRANGSEGVSLQGADVTTIGAPRPQRETSSPATMGTAWRSPVPRATGC